MSCLGSSTLSFEDLDCLPNCFSPRMLTGAISPPVPHSHPSTFTRAPCTFTCAPNTFICAPCTFTCAPSTFTCAPRTFTHAPVHLLAPLESYSCPLTPSVSLLSPPVPLLAPPQPLCWISPTSRARAQALVFVHTNKNWPSGYSCTTTISSTLPLLQEKQLVYEKIKKCR